jgi:hypothetical protein
MPQVIEPAIPQVDIPHMGTSQAAQPQPPQHKTHTQTNLDHPPLPDGVSQKAIDDAIHQVEQTGQTDGIAPAVLAAACLQIEAQAARQGIDLNQDAQANQNAGPPQSGPANYVEAAVMDKQGTFDNFHKQRDSLRSAVADQRQAAESAYPDALKKMGPSSADGQPSASDMEAMKVLATEIKALDPQTIALINAMGVLSNTPEVLKSIIWMEIIRTMRNLISSEARQQVKACMNGDGST